MFLYSSYESFNPAFFGAASAEAWDSCVGVGVASLSGVAESVKRTILISSILYKIQIDHFYMKLYVRNYHKLNETSSII